MKTWFDVNYPIKTLLVRGRSKFVIFFAKDYLITLKLTQSLMHFKRSNSGKVVRNLQTRCCAVASKTFHFMGTLQTCLFAMLNSRLVGTVSQYFWARLWGIHPKPFILSFFSVLKCTQKTLWCLTSQFDAWSDSEKQWVSQRPVHFWFLIVLNENKDTMADVRTCIHTLMSTLSMGAIKGKSWSP